jgi:hypothetical protein
LAVILVLVVFSFMKGILKLPKHFMICNRQKRNACGQKDVALCQHFGKPCHLHRVIERLPQARICHISFFLINSHVISGVTRQFTDGGVEYFFAVIEECLNGIGLLDWKMAD